MKYIYQIPIFILVLFASGYSFASSTSCAMLIDGDIEAFVGNVCSSSSAETTPSDFCVYLNSKPALIARIDALPPELKGKLYADLRDAPDELLDFFDSNPRGVDTWEMLIAHPIMRKDLSILTKFSELLEPSILNKLENGIEDLQKIADKLLHPCCGGSHPFMKSLTLHLDDVKFFINNFSEKPGYEQVIKALQHPLFTVQDGTSFFLTKLRTLDPSQVTRFEGRIVEGLADADDLDAICVLCKFDIELSGGKKLELKSYSSGTINNIATNTSFRNQLRAYLFDANSLSDLEYIFNGVKINDVNLIKGKFREIFEIEATNYFNVFGQNKFENLFGVDNVDDFITDVIPNLNGSSSIYNFIKIQN